MAKAKKFTIKKSATPTKVVASPQVYLVNVVGDIEPELEGPFKNWETLANRAKDLRAEDEGMKNGLFYLEIDAKGKLLKTSNINPQRANHSTLNLSYAISTVAISKIMEKSLAPKVMPSNSLMNWLRTMTFWNMEFLLLNSPKQ